MRIFGGFNRGIHRRIFVRCAAASTAMIVMVSLLAAQIVASHAREQMDANMDMVARHIAAMFDQYILEQKRILTTVSASKHLQNLMRGQFASEFKRYETYHGYDDMAASILANKPYSELHLVLPALHELRSTDPRISTSLLTGDAIPWRSRLEPQDGMQMVETLDLPRMVADDTCFGIALPLNGLVGASTTGTLLITTSARYMSDLAGTLLSEDLARFALIGSERVLFELDQSGAAAKGGHYEARSAQTGWTLSLDWGGNMENGATRGVYWVIFGGALAAVLVMLVVSQAIAAGISRPLRKLTSLLAAVEQGDLSVRAQGAGTDEIGDALRGFNAMAGRMNVLINEVNRGELLWRETEIYALQQQINPHFLYNTLEGINALANRGDTMAIKDVVQKLAGLFRYATQRKHDKLVNIARELDYAREYLDIQRIRFSGTISAAFELDEALTRAQTLPFVLQPLLENAVVHGFLPGERRDCLIGVKIVRERDRVVWRVLDNGLGIDAAKLAALRAKLTAPLSEGAEGGESASIGLSNVAMRIRLRWGEGYGVCVESPAGGGTLVTVTHPFVEGDDRA